MHQLFLEETQTSFTEVMNYFLLHSFYRWRVIVYVYYPTSRSCPSIGVSVNCEAP